MNGLDCRFDYFTEVLIGEELIERSLHRQLESTPHGKKSVVEALELERDTYHATSESMITSYVSGAPNCPTPPPPCDWPKPEPDPIPRSGFRPIIMENVEGVGYGFDVYKVVSGVKTSEKVLTYHLEDLTGTPCEGEDILYYSKEILDPDYTGPAMLVIEKTERSTTDEYWYAFEMA